jgi:hypothetical protein
MADPHQGETVFSTAIGQGIRTARQAATWTVGQRPCRVASPVGGIDSYAQQRLVAAWLANLFLAHVMRGLGACASHETWRANAHGLWT